MSNRELISHRARFEKEIAQRLPRLAESSEWLRGERELSFYGDVDFITTEEYTEEEGRLAIAEARFAVATARKVIRTSRK